MNAPPPKKGCSRAFVPLSCAVVLCLACGFRELRGRNYGCFECGSLALVCRAQQSMLRVVCLAAVLTITRPRLSCSLQGVGGQTIFFFFLCPMLLCIFLFSFLLFGCFTTGRGLVAFATASRDT